MFFNTNKRIYADFNATTPTSSRVVSSMRPYWNEVYANPSSIHTDGVKAQEALTVARKEVAQVIGAHHDEIIFTSGGTESINMALQGMLSGGDVVVTSPIEHRATLETVKYLNTQNISSSFVSVSSSGIVDIKDVREKIQKETRLVSIMLVNNETGVVQPIREVAKIIRKKKKEFGTDIFFHIDASQAPLWLDIKVDTLGADLVSIDGSKIMGPTGVGLLYVRRGVPLRPILFGGGQEFGLRSGTQPIALIAGLACALTDACVKRKDRVSNVQKLRDMFEKSLEERLPGNYVLGNTADRVANTSAVCFPGIDSEFLVLQLDAKGVSASYGSACSSDKHVAGSHVIEAMDLDECKGSMVRFSFGPNNTKKEVFKIVSILEDIVSS